MELHAEDVSADSRNFRPVKGKRSPFLGNAGQNFGQHAGIFEWLVRASPHWDSFSLRNRTAYVWDQHDGRYDSGVSGLGPWSIRAHHGRRTFLPATNLRGNQCADIAALGPFGK